MVSWPEVQKNCSYYCTEDFLSCALALVEIGSQYKQTNVDMIRYRR
jgi:hypothetical protein